MPALDHLRIPIWREGLIALERTALIGHPVWRAPTFPADPARFVLLIPGFLAGDVSLGVLAQWLTRIGYRPCRAGIRANVDCTARSVDRLELQLEDLADRHGRRAIIIGQSRGGAMARILAVRRPDSSSGSSVSGRHSSISSRSTHSSGSRSPRSRCLGRSG